MDPRIGRASPNRPKPVKRSQTTCKTDPRLPGGPRGMLLFHGGPPSHVHHASCDSSPPRLPVGSRRHPHGQPARSLEVAATLPATPARAPAPAPAAAHPAALVVGRCTARCKPCVARLADSGPSLVECARKIRRSGQHRWNSLDFGPTPGQIWPSIGVSVAEISEMCSNLGHAWADRASWTRCYIRVRANTTQHAASSCHRNPAFISTLALCANKPSKCSTPRAGRREQIPPEGWLDFSPPGGPRERS